MRKTSKRSSQQKPYGGSSQKFDERKNQYHHTKAPSRSYTPNYMYTSNALQEEYNPFTEEPVANTKKKARKTRQKTINWIRYIPTLIVIFALGVTLVMTSAYKQELGVQVSHAKDEVKQVEMQNGKIEKQIALTGELRNVEAIAIYNMDMRPPSETEIIYLPPRPEKAQDSDEKGGKNNPIEKVKEVIGMIMR